MPRPLRIHVPGAMYHVTLRGNHRQDIFFTADDRRILTGILREILDRCSARMHAYCYMTNHIHALIQVSDTPLSRLMLLIGSRYARTVQARLATTGHLFEKRYHAILVDADEYLLTLVRYIHLNPVRAKLASSPDDYPWSSHHAYSGSRDEPWVTTAFALSMFHADRHRAITAYRQFVDCQPASSPLLEYNPKDPRILGSDEFAHRLLGRCRKKLSGKTLQQVIDDACVRFGVTAAQLRSPSRLHDLVRARAWIADQSVSAGIASLASVARSFDRHASSLRECMRRYHSSG